MAADTHTVLSGSRRFHRAGAVVLGRADSHEWCEITVKLRRHKELPEPEAGNAVLTREQLAQDFGADPGDVELVSKTLESYGLRVLSADPGALSIKLGGSVAQMEDAFGVNLLRVQHNGSNYRGRVGFIHIPTELHGIVEGVFGLDTRPMINRRRRTSAQTTGTLPDPDKRPWFLPQELAALYNFPENDGRGQSIGIIELGGQFVSSDLTTFAKFAKMPSVPQIGVKNVETVDPQDRNDPDAIGEVMLDVEIVAAVCPGAKITMYFTNFTEKGWVDVLDAVVHDQVEKPTILSISYGLAEGADIWTLQAMQTVDTSMKEAALVGLTVCVAAGDDGSDDQVGDGAAHVNFPASSEYVLSVGGTTLQKSGTGLSESVWFEGDGLRKDGGGATGGGVSAVIRRPSWQSAIAISSVNPHAIVGRCVPDVSANAAGGTGYFMVSSGNPQVSGGTSAATPLWAALLARLGTAGKKVNFLTPLLYVAPKPGDPTLGVAACNDILTGNNSSCAAGGYAAGPGYDAVTGWGSPNGTRLAALLP